MALGVIGEKLGMTQVYDEQGLCIPVTVIKVDPLTVTQVKTVETDGYNAIQVGVVPAKEKHLTKGFQGTVKRHNFSRGPMGHGSKNHRAPGSIGAGTTPGRIYKGKRMAGNMGNEKVTVSKLSVVKIISDKNLLLVKGSVPGPEGKLVTVKPSRTKWN